MILSGDEIRRQLGQGVKIDPFDPRRLNPNSYNLTLHCELLVYEEVVLDMQVPNRYRRIAIPPEGLVLQPQQLYLGRTVERLETHGLVPMVTGRSSLSRMGLFVGGDSQYGDAGYCGFWTLEIYCVQPIRVYAGVEVAQVLYHQLAGEVQEYQSDKYQNACDIQASMMYREIGDNKQNEQQLELDFDSLVRA